MLSEASVMFIFSAFLLSASNLYITNNGNLIFMVMSSDDWAKPVYDNFKKYVNNNIGKELEKTNNM